MTHYGYNLTSLLSGKRLKIAYNLKRNAHNRVATKVKNMPIEIIF